MSQRQFRTDDTSTWSDRFGTGSDGAYAPSTGTDAPTDSACTGTINTTSLSATNAGFATGQLILIHQTQGTGAGQWELNKIASYTAGTITTSYNLIYGYVSGAQVLVMPQYSSGSIAGGVTLTGKAWNGTVGGIYAKFCNGTFTIAGALTGLGVGYRGGAAGINNNRGTQGEAYSGVGSVSSSANNNGGGGGINSNSGGGGGGYSTGGSAGNGYSGGVGAGGSAGAGSVGIANLTTLFPGGGGGGGDSASGSGSVVGQNGGGIILIIAKTITITGSILNNGSNAVASGSFNGDGAGGAGGSVLLKGQALTLGTSLITASGGTGTGDIYSGAGAGGVGRIHADYSTTLTGTTSPTIDSSLDTILNDISSGFFALF